MDPVTTAALISGGTSLLGGILGSRRKPVKNRIDFVQMRKDAEKAGISMKSALMGGAASGYNNSTGGEPTLGASVATALGDAVQTGFNERDRQRDVERDNLEREVMRAELDNIKANTQAVNGRYFGYGIPNATTTTNQPDPTGPTGTGYYRPVGDLYGDDGLLLNRGLPTPLGEANVVEALPPAQAIEDEYGDAVSWGYGVFKGAVDLGYNAHRGLGAGLRALGAPERLSFPKLSFPQLGAQSIAPPNPHFQR